MRHGWRGAAMAAGLAAAIAATACVAAVPVAADAAPADPGGSARIDGAALAADVELLESAYTALHPGLHRYSTPEETRERFAALRAQLATGATLADAYLALSAFTAAVRCGHTHANFHNQSPSTQASLFEHGAHRLPFHFRWIDGEMIVTRSADARLAPGTAVVAVDGVASAAVLATLMPYARADGGNDAKRVAQLEVRGDEEYETFDVFFGLVHGRGKDAYVLRTRAADGAVADVAVRGLNHARRLEMRARGAEDADAVPWIATVPAPGVVMLRMPT